MRPTIKGLIESARSLHARLRPWQRALIYVGSGVLIFVFLGMIGRGKSPPPKVTGELRPYRPGGSVARKGPVSGRVGGLERRGFPRPPGPGVEAGILEEVRLLEGRIGDLRSSVLQAVKEARASAGEETLRAVSQVRRDIQFVSSELRDLKEEISRDRRASKEQGAIELVAIVSAAGLNYAVLRAREGKKRVTEGDRIGPWLVIRIEGEEVTLEGPRERRTLRVE